MMVLQGYFYAFSLFLQVDAVDMAKKPHKGMAWLSFNPFVTNELSHSLHLDKSIFIFWGIRSIFSFLFHFSVNFV